MPKIEDFGFANGGTGAAWGVSFIRRSQSPKGTSD
eukprot:COSAG02_NODE_14255_length_1290_cov_2.476949_2_plen_34_part_01